MLKIRTATLAVVLALVAAACGGGDDGGTEGNETPTDGGTSTASPGEGGTEASGDPIRIGMIDMLSGSNALIGQSDQEGATIAIEQINADGGVLGRPLELVPEDEAPDTNAAVQALRDLNSEGVPFVIGFTSSADALAAAPVAEQIGSVIIGSHPATPSLTGEEFVRNFARVSANDLMSAEALAQFTADNLSDIKRWNVIGFDYVTGHSQWQSWADAMSEQVDGFEMGHEVFFPFTAVSQLTPYITNMVQAVPDDEAAEQGLFLATFGSGTEGLINQGEAYELFERFGATVAIAGGGFLLQARELGDQTPEIYSQYDYYYEAYDTEMNQRFVEDYEAEYGAPPGSWAAHGYQAIYAWKALLEQAGSTDVDAVLDALDSGVTFQAPQGEVLIRGEDHQAVVDVVVRQFAPAPDTEAGFEVVDFQVVDGEDIIPPPSTGGG